MCLGAFICATRDAGAVEHPLLRRVDHAAARGADLGLRRGSPVAEPVGGGPPKPIRGGSARRRGDWRLRLEAEDIEKSHGMLRRKGEVESSQRPAMSNPPLQAMSDPAAPSGLGTPHDCTPALRPLRRPLAAVLIGCSLAGGAPAAPRAPMSPGGGKHPSRKTNMATNDAAGAFTAVELKGLVGERIGPWKQTSPTFRWRAAPCRGR